MKKILAILLLGIVLTGCAENRVPRTGMIEWRQNQTESVSTSSISYADEMITIVGTLKPAFSDTFKHWQNGYTFAAEALIGNNLTNLTTIPCNFYADESFTAQKAFSFRVEIPMGSYEGYPTIAVINVPTQTDSFTITLKMGW